MSGGRFPGNEVVKCPGETPGRFSAPVKCPGETPEPFSALAKCPGETPEPFSAPVKCPGETSERFSALVKCPGETPERFSALGVGESLRTKIMPPATWRCQPPRLRATRRPAWRQIGHPR